MSKDVSGSESVRVFVRCRPLSHLEKSSGLRRIVTLLEDDGEVDVEEPSSQANSALKTFSFDAVFDSDSSQKQVSCSLSLMVLGIA